MKNKKIKLNLKNRYILYGTLGVIIAAIFTLSIVYAALSVTLNIEGNATVNSAEWGISITEEDMSEAMTEEAISYGYKILDKNYIGRGDGKLIKKATISGTTISGIEVSLTKPGDIVFGAYKVTNIGNIPMKVESIKHNAANISSSTNNQSDIAWIYQSIEGDVGMDSLSVGDILCPGESDSMLFIVGIKEDITSVPSSTLTIANLGVTVNFVQADQNEC